MASSVTPSLRLAPARTPFRLRSVQPLPLQRPLQPARWPADDRAGQRLLVIDRASATLQDRTLRDLGELLTPGDLLVFNDAATLPASLSATTEAGARLELRLARESGGVFWAVVLGSGDWRSRTEDRLPPPALAVGDTLTLTSASSDRAPPLTARVVDLAPLGAAYSRASPLIALEFAATGAALWNGLYRAGRPIQYSHVERALELWHVQNVFASRPWAFELASAAHGFDWALLLALKRRGIRLAALTHAAGISSTGSQELDRALPFPERYEIPEATVRAICETRREQQRVVAVGTSVVRALESARTGTELRAGRGEATLVLGPERERRRAERPTRTRPRVVDSVISGIHQAGESHYSLLEAFAPAALLERADAHARALGYRVHEFGDACLVL